MRLSNEVLAVLDRLAIDGRAVTITSQLDRGLYENVNKALVALGGKWNRSARAHLFPDDPSDAIENAQMTGMVVDLKKAYDFFETPPSVVDALLGDACIPEGSVSILEPSAGRGAIAGAIRTHYPKAKLQVCELMPENRGFLMRHQFEVIGDDFLKLHGKRFDRIVMNPPFSKQQDVDHVLHARSLLENDGILAAVMAAGITFRDNAKTNLLKSLIKGRGRIDPLPEGSFKVSGTAVNTVIVQLRR